MEYIKLFVVGFTGYLLSGFHDLAMLYNNSSLRRLLSLGFFITAVPYIILFGTHTSPHGMAAILATILLLTLFSLLLVYSVFIETALFSHNAGNLYMEGTYGFSRHPGFLWYTVIGFLVSIYFWDYRITLMCLGLIMCNLFLITIEDFLLFPKMFQNYDAYKQQTPFLISLKKLHFWRRAQ